MYLNRIYFPDVSIQINSYIYIHWVYKCIENHDFNSIFLVSLNFLTSVMLDGSKYSTLFVLLTRQQTNITGSIMCC